MFKDYKTASQLIEICEERIRSAEIMSPESRNEAFIYRQMAERLRAYQSMKRLAIRVSVCQGVVAFLKDDCIPDEPMKMSESDRAVLTSWLDILLQFGDSDLQKFTEKHVIDWMSSVNAGDWVTPIPAEYAYKVSKGER